MRSRFLWIGRRLSRMRRMSLSWTRQMLVCGCGGDNGRQDYRKPLILKPVVAGVRFVNWNPFQINAVQCGSRMSAVTPAD